MIAQEGIDFKTACERITKEYEARSRLWASWGDYDRRQFERTCALYKIGYPFGTAHLNAKTLFALKHRLSHEVGMDGALKLLNIPLEGTHHRGIDDAHNIAKILRTLI
jgi:inhibitor of KinA sporulation pathway (predicted exonuclease)